MSTPCASSAPTPLGYQVPRTYCHRSFGQKDLELFLTISGRFWLNGPFVPLAVGAYIMAWGTMGGPYDGASMNPARSFGPDVALGNLSTWWVYLIGPVAGAVIAVGGTCEAYHRAL